MPPASEQHGEELYIDKFKGDNYYNNTIGGHNTPCKESRDGSTPPRLHQSAYNHDNHNHDDGDDNDDWLMSVIKDNGSGKGNGSGGGGKSPMSDAPVDSGGSSGSDHRPPPVPPRRRIQPPLPPFGPKRSLGHSRAQTLSWGSKNEVQV